MKYLLVSYFLIISGYAVLIFVTMQRSILPRYKAFIYGVLTLALLMGIFLVFDHYEKEWKSPVPLQGQGNK